MDPSPVQRDAATSAAVPDGQAPRPKGSPFAAAVAAGIAILGNLAVLHPDVTSGALERSLRYELDRLPGRDPRSHPAAAAVVTACSHLATRAYEDAYLALLTARSLL